MILGKVLIRCILSILRIKRTAVLAPLFYAGVFILYGTGGSQRLGFTKGMTLILYDRWCLFPSVIPALITVHNFGDKEFQCYEQLDEYGGNVGQINGPTIAAFVFDVTGTFRMAWIISAV